MKNKYYKITISTILMFILINIVCLYKVEGFEIEETEIESNIVYDNWMNLLEEEKENYIEPVQFSIPYEKKKDITSNNINYVLSGLKATYADKYTINNMKVKNQGNTMQCWAFSATSVIESNIEKTTNQKSVELSPRHMDYATSKTFLDGTNKNAYNRELKAGGNFLIAMGYCTSGRGPVLEEDMPFIDSEEKISLSEIENKNVVTKIDEYVTFPTVVKEYTVDGKTLCTNGLTNENKVYYSDEDMKNIRQSIKEHIIKYGAITSFTYAGQQDSLKYYNVEKLKNGTPEGYAYFCNKTDAIPDHAITIVGWDDNYSKENFSDEFKPQSDGAYIVLNSYGEEKFNNGYYYISYEDFLVEYSVYGVSKTADVEYDNIYQYDDLGYSYVYQYSLGPAKIANVFEKNKANSNKENLTEVSFVTGKLTDVKIYVNSKNDDIAQSELVGELKNVEAGYHTYKLKEPIEITGDKFVVALNYTCDGATAIPLELNYKSNNKGSNFWDTATSNSGESLMSIDGNRWYDFSLLYKDANFCIKAFTEYEENKNIDVTSIVINADDSTIMNINDEIQLSAVIMPLNATNKEVEWKSSDDKIVSVSSLGLVKAISSGKATITATNVASGKSDSIEITVSQENINIPVANIFIDPIINKYENGTTLDVGDRYTFKISISPENATVKNIKWSSSDTSIATVDPNGVITAISEGKTTIEALNEESGVSCSVIVNVLSKNSNNVVGDNSQGNNQNDKDNIVPPDKDISIKIDETTKVEDKITLNQEKDTTLSTIAIPNAGIKYGIILVIVLVIGKLIFVAKKYVNMRDVK